MRRPVLVTGGAGFIGANVCDRIAAGGTPVLIYDNLSRSGVDQNIAWLESEYRDAIEVQIADVRDRSELRRAVVMVRSLSPRTGIRSRSSLPRRPTD